MLALSLDAVQYELFVERQAACALQVMLTVFLALALAMVAGEGRQWSSLPRAACNCKLHACC